MNKMLSKYNDEFQQVWNDKCMNYEFIESELKAVPRIIVIGDIHGDMKALIKCLEIAKVINKKRQWIGEDTVIVQVGDQIDSCRFNGMKCDEINNYEIDSPDDIKILFFMTKLHNKAVKHGGAVYSLMGNHELMNVVGDMTYVSYSNLKYLKNNSINDNTMENGIAIRKELFKPGNIIANFLACTRKVALKIGSNLFVHAGIVENISKEYNIDDMNKALTLYLLNKSNDINKFNNDFMGKDSPLWTRDYNNSNPDNCNSINTITDTYKVGRIIVGHTPQLNHGIRPSCNDKIWFTDVAMSHSFNIFDENLVKTGKKNKHRECQVLEILKDGEIIRPLYL